MLTKRSLRILLSLCIFVTLALSLSGCWDAKQIENHGYVYGVAIDYASPEPKGQYDLPHVTQETGIRKYHVTFELPRFLKGKNGDDEQTHILFVGEGESMFAIFRAIAAKTYFKLFLEDIQVLIFSEAVARDGIGDLLDFFSRDHEMRRRVKLMVTPGRAEDILTGKLQSEDPNSLYIIKIMKNVRNVPRFAIKSDLGDVSEAIRNKNAFFLTMVEIENGDIKLTKSALFDKDKKMVGAVDEWELIGGKILNKSLKSGFVTLTNPANPEKLIAFEIFESKIDINSFIIDDKLSFSLDARFIGNLVENTETKQKALDPAFLKDIEQGLAEQFTRQVEDEYHKAQELKSDHLKLGGLVHRQHPDYWEKVKDRWNDEVFPTVPLNASIKVIVRRPGMTN